MLLLTGRRFSAPLLTKVPFSTAKSQLDCFSERQIAPDRSSQSLCSLHNMLERKVINRIWQLVVVNLIFLSRLKVPVVRSNVFTPNTYRCLSPLSYSVTRPCSVIIPRSLSRAVETYSVLVSSLLTNVSSTLQVATACDPQSTKSPIAESFK